MGQWQHWLRCVVTIARICSQLWTFRTKTLNVSPTPRSEQVPIALFGFVVAATWIDWIADRLVALLDFLGIILRIPNYIMGLSVLAWGNSMADLSANLTMARKGLANLAITACFAGPVFNILIGLGAGFGVLRSVSGNEINYVELTPPITIGFVFCFMSCGMLIFCGLAIHPRGVIPAAYGYAAVVLYTLYIVTSLLLQFLLWIPSNIPSLLGWWLLNNIKRMFSHNALLIAGMNRRS